MNPAFLDVRTSQKEVIADLLWRHADSGRPTHLSVTKEGHEYNVTLSVPADEPAEGSVTSS